jgi:hypothetical protein
MLFKNNKSESKNKSVANQIHYLKVGDIKLLRKKLNNHKSFIDFTEQDFFYNIPLRFCLFLQQDLC